MKGEREGEGDKQDGSEITFCCVVTDVGEAMRRVEVSGKQVKEEGRERRAY